MLDPAVIKRLRAHGDWPAFQGYLGALIDALDHTGGIEGDDRTIAIKVIGRQRAAQALRTLLQPFIDAPEAEDHEQVMREKLTDAGL